MVLIKAGMAGIAMWTFFAFTYKKVLRFSTGWEDPTTKEFERKRIEKFLQAN